jgi:8-oxo-dGTP pyrophosphatase MutT (NUDIX family)
MKRHLTATGFVVDNSRTLLHWHRRLQQWMPPGGHIEADEDPVQAVLREIREETGLTAAIVPQNPRLAFQQPEQLPAPYTILIEEIPGPDEPHQHIDLIYFCRPIDSTLGDPVPDRTLRWVDESELRSNVALDVAGCGVSVAVPDDVRELALLAIETVRRAMPHA